MKTTTVSVESMIIPSYPVLPQEKLPMFTENRNHQGTTGKPYPAMPVLNASPDGRYDKEYEVVRLENDYIRLMIIPSLGGRIFEAYDKINHYDFLYRQHVIKPSLIGAYGLWISGGLEFNWPFHHRPSTFMPVNFSAETEEDGTGIVWLSECDPTDRTHSTIGIVLHPESAYFETRARVVNRTPLRRSFLMWQNAAVPVNDNYQFVFPPDVNYVTHHHHADRTPMTYPVAQGKYSTIYYDEPVDISWFKNTHGATSHFSAPSKYDFFGGYDHGKHAGVIHIGDHHVSPGKKMFTWGTEDVAHNWEETLTDSDGPYCELMAGSYSNNQPDFTWLNPYESKEFSEFWYPVGDIGKTSFATLAAAVHVDESAGKLWLETTSEEKNLHVVLARNCEKKLDTTVCSAKPCTVTEIDFAPFCGLYTVDVENEKGENILHYQQETLPQGNIPAPIEQTPNIEHMETVEELYLQGLHILQYRHPAVAPEVYLNEALKRDRHHYPSMILLAECKLRKGFYTEAKELLEKAITEEHRYNLHYPDTEAEYLLGLTLRELGEDEISYDTLYHSAWSSFRVPMAMCALAQADGRRGDWKKMYDHSICALKSAAEHPLASAYAALAARKMGMEKEAIQLTDAALSCDCMNDLAIYVKTLLSGQDISNFFSHCRSDFSQTALDIAYDLAEAGLFDEAAKILEAVEAPSTPMVAYTLGYIAHLQGNERAAEKWRKAASARSVTGFFPCRLKEITTLRWADSFDDDPAAANLLACELYDKEHYTEAASLWEKAISLNPGNAEYYRNLAIACVSHLGRKPEGVDLMEKAVSLQPDNQQLIIEYLYAADKTGTPAEKRLAVMAHYPVRGRLRDDYVMETVKVLCFAGKYDEAMEMMLSHRFMPAEGGEVTIIEGYFTICLHRVKELLSKGLPEDALRVVDEALNLPRNLHCGFWNETTKIPMQYYQAEALRQMGREEESKAAYEQVIKRCSIDSPDPELAYYFLSALDHLDKHQEARRYLSKVKAMIAEREATPSLGYESTISAFNSFVTDGSVQRKATDKYWLGMLAKYEGQPDKAKSLFSEAVSLMPDDMNASEELKFAR